MAIQHQVGLEMLTAETGLVIRLAADFLCLPVVEQYTMTGQRSSFHDGQEMTLERHTCSSCAVATSTRGAR